MRRSLPLLALTFVTVAGTASPAFAQGTDAVARAAHLFDAGRDAMKSGDVARACALFAESQKVDPAVGTQLNLAACYEKAGRTASAWGVYREVAVAARRAGQVDRQKLAEARIAALQPTLASLRVVVDAGAGEGLAVQLDGVDVGRAEWGIAAPVDPGGHKVTASQPGKRAWSSDVVVAAAAKVDIAVPLLAAEAPEPAKEAPPPPFWTGVRVAGVVVAGAGLVGVGVGAGFGLDAASKNSQALTHCPEGVSCNDMTGVNLTNQALSSATVSTAAFAVGGALVAVGALVFFGGPLLSHREPVLASMQLTPVGGPHAAGMALGGSW
jgi:hypothetical protein